MASPRLKESGVLAVEMGCDALFIISDFHCWRAELVGNETNVNVIERIDTTQYHGLFVSTMLGE